MTAAADIARTVDTGDLKDMLNDRAEAFAAHIFPAGKRDRNEWKIGSVYGEAGQSLGIELAGPNIGLWHDRATGQGGDWIDLYQVVRKVSFPTAVDGICDWLGVGREHGRRRETLFNVEPVGEAAAQTLALLPPTERINAILKLSRPITGTPAAKYLIGRGLDPELASADALRYLPPLGRYPATMVAVVTDFADASKILSLQFTAIRPDYSRGHRTFLKGAKIKNGVLRIMDDAEVTWSLGLSEGTESGLAVMTAMRRAGHMVLPIWSALNAGNLGKLPVLPVIEKLSVYADSDKNGVGQRAAQSLAARWHAAGREAFICSPPASPGCSRDWNE